MCWSFGVSLLFAIVGFSIAAYLAFKKKSKLLWMPLGFFALMELLQTITYLYLNNCNLPINQLLTYLQFLHISFQPLFINMLGLYFIPKRVREKISGFVYAICFVGVILMLIKIYPFEWAGVCTSVGTMCGESLCSMSGGWHFIWQIPLNNIAFLMLFGYIFTAFLLPFIYGSWKVNLYHLIFGPLLASLITSNSGEMITVWCLLSVAILAIILIPRLRKSLHVKKWYFWNYPFKKSKK